MKGIELPKFRIDCIHFFCDHYDRIVDILEVHGVTEGDYRRIKIPQWLKKLFEEAYQAGKRARSKEIASLLKGDK